MRLIPFVLALFLLSCGGPQKGERPFVLNLNLDAGLNSLDPAFARDQNSIWMATQLYQTLVQLDQDLNVVPGLAKSWEINEAKTRYTFYLSRNHFYTYDGDNSTPPPVVAGDVVFSLERLLDPALASPGAWLLRDRIKNLRAVNDTVLVLELHQPFGPILPILSMAYTSVINPQEAAKGQLRTRPAGSGPYRLGSWNEGEALVLLRNPQHPYFRENSTPEVPEACVVRFNPDRYSAFLELLNGRLDLLLAIDGGLQNEILGPDGQIKSSFGSRVRLHKSPYLNTEYLGFGPELKDPWTRVEVRQALALLVDRTRLIRYLRNGIGLPGEGGMIPPGLEGHTRAGYDFNPQKAKELLARAGFPGGQGLPPIRLSVSPNYKDMGEFLVEQWAKYGIPVRLATEPGFAIREKMAKGGLDLFRASWIADYPDPENYLALFYGPNKAPSGPNYTRFQTSVFDQDYRRMARGGSAQRSRDCARMDSLVMEQAPVIVLYYDECARIARPGLSGVEPDAVNSLKLWKISRTGE